MFLVVLVKGVILIFGGSDLILFLILNILFYYSVISILVVLDYIVVWGMLLF